MSAVDLGCHFSAASVCLEGCHLVNTAFQKHLQFIWQGVGACAPLSERGKGEAKTEGPVSMILCFKRKTACICQTIINLNQIWVEI